MTPRREHHDPETGVLNQVGLERALDSELSRAARHELPLSLVLIEISASSPLDEQETSLVARRAGKALEERARSEDHVARLAPSRFAVLAVETSESETLAGDLAAHVRGEVSDASEAGKELTVSAGSVDCQYDELPQQELVREAERSLAQAILTDAGVAFPAPAGEVPSATSRSDQRL
jgi:diguanylate cyclase (GGDEF)-like protein